MTVLVATDLDQTLIYSARSARLPEVAPLLVPVEDHGGKPVSHMTAQAAHGFAALAGRACVVPVTTRLPAQFERVRLPGPPPRYAVCCNGGRLYVDGVMDRGWSARVTEVLRPGVPFREVWDHVGRLCRPEFTHRLRAAEGLFCYAMVRVERLPPGFVEEVGGWAAERGWRTSLQGRKLYWVPAALTKSAAVAEIADRVGASVVLAAGDSLLDAELLVHADRAIHPAHGELFDRGWAVPGVETTAVDGILAGEQIVGWLAARARAAMASTVEGVRTAVKVTRTKVTLEDLRARARAFEEQNPGYDRTNYVDLFRDKASGELLESAEFFEVSRLYRRLARAEKVA